MTATDWMNRRLLIIMGDFLFSWVALAIAVYVWAVAQLQDQALMVFIQQRLQNWFYLLPIVWVILIIDIYDSRISNDLKKTFRSIMVSALIGAVIYLVVYFASDGARNVTGQTLNIDGGLIPD